MRAVTAATLFLLGTALAGASDDPPAMSAAEVRAAFGGDVLPAWEKPELRQYDFWLGRWEANWRQRPRGEFFHEAAGNLADHDRA